PNFGGWTISSIAIAPHDSGIVFAASPDYVTPEVTSNYPGLFFLPPIHVKVFRSTDGGSNWNPVLDLGGGGLVSFAFDLQNRGTVYAGGAFSVFKSIDAGANWVALQTWRSFSVESLGIDPRNPATLYASGRSGLFKSTDGGTNWQSADSGMTYIDPSDGR